MDLHVNVRESSSEVRIIDLTGEIDIRSSPKLKDAITRLIDEKHYNLVITFEHVKYIDSSGLGAMLGGLKRVQEHGGEITVVCTNPQIKSIFDITGLSRKFGIFDDEKSAIGAAAAAA